MTLLIFSGGATGGGLRGICPPRSQKSAKIVKEKWHKIRWVYLWIEKLRQNPPISPGFFRAGAATAYIHFETFVGKRSFSTNLKYNMMKN